LKYTEELFNDHNSTCSMFCFYGNADTQKKLTELSRNKKTTYLNMTSTQNNQM